MMSPGRAAATRCGEWFRAGRVRHGSDHFYRLAWDRGDGRLACHSSVDAAGRHGRAAWSIRSASYPRHPSNSRRPVRTFTIQVTSRAGGRCSKEPACQPEGSIQMPSITNGADNILLRATGVVQGRWVFRGRLLASWTLGPGCDDRARSRSLRPPGFLVAIGPLRSPPAAANRS
jgi:hypothetical protein